MEITTDTMLMPLMGVVEVKLETRKACKENNVEVINTIVIPLLANSYVMDQYLSVKNDKQIRQVHAVVVYYNKEFDYTDLHQEKNTQ